MTENERGELLVLGNQKFKYYRIQGYMIKIASTKLQEAVFRGMLLFFRHHFLNTAIILCLELRNRFFENL